jgi:hypothetical protein
VGAEVGAAVGSAVGDAVGSCQQADDTRVRRRSIK